MRESQQRRRRRGWPTSFALFSPRSHSLLITMLPITSIACHAACGVPPSLHLANKREETPFLFNSGEVVFIFVERYRSGAPGELVK